MSVCLSVLHATAYKHLQIRVSTNVSHTSARAECFARHLDEKYEDQLSSLYQRSVNDIIVLVMGRHNADALKTSSKHLTAAMRATQSTPGTKSILQEK